MTTRKKVVQSEIVKLCMSFVQYTFFMIPNQVAVPGSC